MLRTVLDDLAVGDDGVEGLHILWGETEELIHEGPKGMPLGVDALVPLIVLSVQSDRPLEAQSCTKRLLEIESVELLHELVVAEAAELTALGAQEIAVGRGVRIVTARALPRIDRPVQDRLVQFDD